MEIRYHDEGRGPVVLVVGPGLDDGSRTQKLAGLLSDRFRVVRLHRRQYRLDLKTGGPCSIAQEARDVLAVAREVGGPAIVYGHSSGGVVALEALAASPETFAGGVVFEPAAVIGAPLGDTVVPRARAAIAAGEPGRALTLSLRDTVGLTVAQARLAGAVTSVMPHYRRLIPAQIDDLEALDRLGVRLDTYATIPVPVALLAGERSPAHLRERVDAVAAVVPDSVRIVLRGLDHGADLKAAKTVAGVIASFADKVLRPE